MTKYRLKDKEKQQALEKALPGFAELLQEGCERDFGTASTDVLVMSNFESVVDLWEISIPKVWIDKIEEYDASAWNPYPDVTPPARQLMCVEAHKAGYRRVQRHIAIFDCGWRDPNTPEEPLLDCQVLRFRPLEN